MVSTQSGLDGTFKMPDIPEGEYWVIAQSAGYIFPVGTVPQGVQRTDVAKIMQNVQTVRVSADRTSDVRLTMQRGASIMGKSDAGRRYTAEQPVRSGWLRSGTGRRGEQRLDGVWGRFLIAAPHLPKRTTRECIGYQVLRRVSTL